MHYTDDALFRIEGKASTFTNSFSSFLGQLEIIQAPVWAVDTEVDPVTKFYNAVTVCSAAWADEFPCLCFHGPEVHHFFADLLLAMSHREIIFFGGKYERWFYNSADVQPVLSAGTAIGDAGVNCSLKEVLVAYGCQINKTAYGFGKDKDFEATAHYSLYSSPHPLPVAAQRYAVTDVLGLSELLATGRPNGDYAIVINRGAYHAIRVHADEANCHPDILEKVGCPTKTFKFTDGMVINNCSFARPQSISFKRCYEMEKRTRGSPYYGQAMTALDVGSTDLSRYQREGANCVYLSALVTALDLLCDRKIINDQ